MSLRSPQVHVCVDDLQLHDLVFFDEDAENLTCLDYSQMPRPRIEL